DSDPLMYITIFVLALIFVIMFHEFGHYATAKLFGMKVERFFLGFGPSLWSFRRGETTYGVKAIPAGGFVKIVGMNEFEEVAEADQPRAFYRQAAWKRAIVLIAGSFTHFVVALVLIFVALAFIGLPTAEVPPTNEIAVVVDGSPAAAAGLQGGDVVVDVDGVPTTDFDAIRGALEDRAGETIAVTVRRDGATLQLQPTLATQDTEGNPGAFLGVGPRPVVRRLPVGAALAGTVSGDFSVLRLTELTMSGLAQLFTPDALAEWFRSVNDPGPRDLNGPISLVGVGQAVNAFGVGGDLFAVIVILAQLNIVLGIMNLLPLPPLDGGHLAVLAIEESVNGVRRLRGRSATWRLDPSVITPIALVVILFFVVLSVTALYVDIVKPASELLEQ
ncbi:MAG: M50 family metallopeptidase, partial [Egibacteraceae bacterium]